MPSDKVSGVMPAGAPVGEASGGPRASAWPKATRSAGGTLPSARGISGDSNGDCAGWDASKVGTLCRGSCARCEASGKAAPGVAPRPCAAAAVGHVIPVGGPLASIAGGLYPNAGEFGVAAGRWLALGMVLGGTDCCHGGSNVDAVGLPGSCGGAIGGSGTPGGSTGGGGTLGATTVGAEYLGAGGSALGVPAQLNCSVAPAADSSAGFSSTAPHGRISESNEIRLPVPASMLDCGDGTESVSKVSPIGDMVPVLHESKSSCGFSDPRDSLGNSGLMGGSEGLPDAVLSDASER
mmetsp:Transcript_7744/g.24111  ORF Transcript_7744/g.24111 Transcript_7744/m.24111 type:complete len:294 (+) Transcript_7744:488-1369(+)